MRSRRCAWPGRRSSSRRHARWLLGDDGGAAPRRRCARSSTAARRCRSGSPAAGSSIPRRPIEALAAAWERAMAALAERSADADAGVSRIAVTPRSSRWRELDRSTAGSWRGTAPGTTPGADALDPLDWMPARVPGTVAGALRDAALRRRGERRRPRRPRLVVSHAVRRRRPPATARRSCLRSTGIATVAEVYLNGELRARRSESMFAAHAVDVGGALRRRQRAGDLLPRARPAAARPPAAAGALAHAARRRRQPALLSHDVARSRCRVCARAAGRRPVAPGAARAPPRRRAASELDAAPAAARADAACSRSRGCIAVRSLAADASERRSSRADRRRRAQRRVSS